jgi:hypothetical protein
VAKRRTRSGPDPEGSDEERPASAEDRRKERKRLRAAREAGNVRGKDRPSWVRRGLIFGIPTAIIVVVIVVLLVNPFQPPCIQFQPIPASSGIPAFPPHNTTDFSTTWCPNAPSVFSAYPQLTIEIGSTTVALPTSIGRESNFTQGGSPYACDLPIQTNTVAQGGASPNTIYILSPWPYIYNLSVFFSVWAQSYSKADVNSSYSSQPITYTPTDLLGFTNDATHSVSLWVDNQISSAGPNLNLDTLSNNPNVYPSCIGSIYGTSHTILLRYGSTGTKAVDRGVVSPVLATGGSPVDLALEAYGSPAPLVEGALRTFGMIAYLHLKGLDWLVLRSS